VPSWKGESFQSNYPALVHAGDDVRAFYGRTMMALTIDGVRVFNALIGFGIEPDAVEIINGR
jgi:hypothetical protein